MFNFHYNGKLITECSISELAKADAEGEYYRLSCINAREFVDTYNDFLKFANDYIIILEGKLIGYRIQCPFCHIVYNIDTRINKFDVQCKDCGKFYNQRDNIKELIVDE